MPEVRYCENCKYCRTKKGHYNNTWLECKQFGIEVVEDDYCSFGADIPETDNEDKAYEYYKEALLERRDHEAN